MIRTANEKGLLLGNLENWTEYRKKRNITSHVYDEAKALAVISIMDNFAKEVEFFINKLEEKHLPQMKKSTILDKYLFAKKILRHRFSDSISETRIRHLKTVHITA